MKKMRAKKNPAYGAQIVLTLETDGARADELFDWLGEAFAPLAWDLLPLRLLYLPPLAEFGFLQEQTPRHPLDQESDPVTAAHPISTCIQPAAPPHTMFCGVRRLSNIV